jgi:hypothetical protein
MAAKGVPTAVSRQIAARRRVKQALDRQRLIISKKRYRNGEMSALVLMGGQYFDVSEWELGLLRQGATPRELGLFPVADDGA